MTKLPYKGKALIDEAVMENQEALRELVTILKASGISEAETYRRIGIVVDRLHKVSDGLKSIPVECKEENKNAPVGHDQSG